MSVETYLGSKPDRSKFAAWAKKRQLFLHPDVAFLVPTKTMGLGVYAAKALKSGTTVVSCPMSSAISPYEHPNAENPSIAALQAMKKELPSLDGASFVCLRLMAELSRPHSPWRTWLECCPRMDRHLFHLSEALRRKAFYTPDRRDSEQKKLSGWTNLAQQLEQLDLDAKWQRVRPLLDPYPAIWPPSLATWDMFVSCMMQVLSRNFHREEIRGQEGPYLLPGVDFINHSFAHANVEFVMHGGGRKNDLSFDVALTRDVQRGEQIYHNYGELSEARFCVEFQFLTAPPRSSSSTTTTTIKADGGSTENTNRSNLPTGPEETANPNECLLFSRHVLVSIGEAVLMHEAGESGAEVNWEMYHLADRLEQLHRFSLIDDEGLQIRPTGGGGSSDSALPHELLNMVHLLTCLDDHAFQATICKVTRHWVCPKTPALFAKARVWLSCRQAALSESMEEVEELRRVAAEQPEALGLQSDAAASATRAALDMSIAVLRSEARQLALLTSALLRP